jgi:predicted HD phosphohydrolase
VISVEHAASPAGRLHQSGAITKRVPRLARVVLRPHVSDQRYACAHAPSDVSSIPASSPRVTGFSGGRMR